MQGAHNHHAPTGGLHFLRLLHKRTTATTHQHHLYITENIDAQVKLHKRTENTTILLRRRTKIKGLAGIVLDIITADTLSTTGQFQMMDKRNEIEQQKAKVVPFRARRSQWAHRPRQAWPPPKAALHCSRAPGEKKER